jgi:serine/threonine protein kinase
MIGTHPNIVELLGWDDLWVPEAPALFFDYCSLGDGWYYYYKLKYKLKYVPEMTLWKLMADISQGLNFLHNGFPDRIYHGDAKPNNILIQLPHGQYCNKGQVAVLLTSKLADLPGLLSTLDMHQLIRTRELGRMRRHSQNRRKKPLRRVISGVSVRLSSFSHMVGN